MPILALLRLIGVRGFLALALAAALGVCYLGYKVEKAAKEKAQAALATAKLAAEISQQQVLLYQEREAIQAKAAKRRGKLNELRAKGDLDGLSNDFNTAGGVLRPGGPNPPGGAKPATRYHPAQGAGPTYHEAPR